MKLYAAYGSNLNIGQMKGRAPRAVLHGKTLLLDHRLVFRVVADVIPAKGFKVPLGIWRISDECEAALDRYEGVQGGLYRKEMITIANSEQRALIYVMNSKGIAMPSESYFASIEQGYDDFDLDAAFLYDALDHSQNRAYTSKFVRRKRKQIETSEAKGN